jgi:hypothetical protein
MDYSTKTKAELVDLCKEKGVVGYSKKNKEQLISLLEAIPITPAPSSPSVPKTRSKTKREAEAKAEEEEGFDTSREYTITENEQNAYKNNTKSKFKTAEEEFAWSRTQTKKCNKCKETLPLTYFAGNTSSSDHFDRNGYRLRRGDCKKCNKSHSSGKTEAIKIAKSLGMSHKAPEGTKCELCETTDNIVFDHSHDTNIFRGWLCDPCNRSMGVLGDNVKGLLQVLNYLNKSEKKKIVFNGKTFELSIGK